VARARGRGCPCRMTGQPSIQWLEDLLEGQYGFAPTVEMRDRLGALSGKQPKILEEPAERRAAWLREVAESLVVSETYFFREPAQIEFCVREIVHQRLTEEGSAHTIRILSAGCSSGEEAYSLAIAVEALFGPLASRVSIVGVDVSAAAIRKANRARYSAWSLRATPTSIRERCFRRRGDEYELDARFRAGVRFEERNLFDDHPELWAPGAFDVIFCRNVAIYFSPRALRDLALRFARILSPGGCLFLGHSETLRGISDDFDLQNVGNVFYYRRKGAAGAPRPSAPRPSDAAPAPSPPSPPALFSLARSPAEVDARRGTMDRQRVVSLIGAERFDEAMAALEAMPADAPSTLFGAVIHMARGEFEDAEAACFTLLSSALCVAEAHCLLGLCREHRRAFDSAERHYREAARADGRFAMPRLRLGLLLDRSGDGAGARPLLEQALSLLEAEDLERIALFGGGFSRSVLLDVCRERLAR